MSPRICHVITGLQVGGAEMTLLRHVRALRAIGADSFVVCLEGEGPLGAELRSTGVDVFCLGARASRPDPRVITKLARLIREGDATSVQTWMYHANLVGGLAARLAGVPVAWGIHQTTLLEDLTSGRTRFVARAGAVSSRWLCDAIVYCASAARAAHEADGYVPSKGLVIPNGWEVPSEAPDRELGRRLLGLSADLAVVGHVARFDPYKNHVGLLRSLADVQAARPDVVVVMIGPGVDGAAEHLRRAVPAADWGRIHLHGVRRDVDKLMPGFDVLVSASTMEALPTVVGEAMAAGVPAVVTDVGDSKELVGASGRLVAPGDGGAITRAVLEVLELEPEGRSALITAGRERISSRFSLEVSVGRYLDLHRQLAARGRR